MLPPHIQEREDRKTLDLLKFALEKAGVDRRSWEAAYSLSDLPYVDDCLCIFKEKDAWKVAYNERGSWDWRGSFPSSFYAAQFHFSQATGRPNLYSYREKWEAETGQSFSLID